MPGSPQSTIVQKSWRLCQSLLFDPTYFWPLATLVIIGDALLTGLIIKYVPYTEIDWETYMIQVKVFLGGEHNYSKLTGPTGPLVYPAGHVHIHKWLYQLTDAGKNIQLAQYLYGMLYLTTLVLSCSIYRTAGNIPNWVLFLLPLSKRLHSIFALRLFNDCWAIAAVQIAILLFQTESYKLGMVFFSLALSVKMSILLYLPGLLVIVFIRKGLASTLQLLLILVATQVRFAMDFLVKDPWAYLHAAFDFGRVFLYKWTVNWRIFDEETFLSPKLSAALLLGHISTLVAFGLFKWCERDGGIYSVLSRGLRMPSIRAGLRESSADYTATVLFTSNLIGILFARSLHYQFYSWYAHQIPFLTWRSKFPVVIKLTLIFAIEYAWNVFPSTRLSSGILLASNTLLLLGIWFGYSTGMET
ncbi:dolichyl-P-Man:Man(5)GlcNAc(2)-PP-dolichyl mannosyltransferase [Crepidotus variabilis]|uniref:Dol-P-Man:Man(5)GlcNAc(2)-PP-Dol alpha-1,3-mannosyltransferase n=1 Tax=Crepidotus variabilis TaxID=179855 RepID=A0A9P6JTV6_9AGAR|nr:dolichyl-P-Man:Man(5)GlcNAc(2)-PP-dolichyl mannosyltransferase [Crepidotus variabilis]